MRNDLLKLAAKGAAGFSAGLILWLVFSAPYAQLLAAVSDTLVRASENPAVTSITPQDTLLLVSRSDLASPESGQFGVESTDLTFNVILIAALFAARAKPLTFRNAGAFLAAAVALFIVHATVVIFFVKYHYAADLGSWSTDHYGLWARRFWTAGPYFYSVIGVYALPFILWWTFRQTSDEPLLRGERRRLEIKSRRQSAHA